MHRPGAYSGPTRPWLCHRALIRLVELDNYSRRKHIASVKNSNFGWALFSIMLFVIGIVATILYVQVSTTPCGCGPVTPVVKEKLGFNNVSMTSPTSIRLSIANTGSVLISFYEYILQDSRGDGYTNNTWSEPYQSPPSLSPGGALTEDLSLTGSLTGQSFQFQSGQGYTVELVTSRNNLFTHSFTA